MAKELGRPKIKRRQYLIKREFQLKFAGQVLALMFLTAALCSYVVYYTTMILMGEKLASVYPQGRLVSLVRMVNFRILISLFLVTPLVGLISIFLSHRIAGPVFRMERSLRNMASGDLSEHITLRKKDELKSLAEGINAVVESLKSSIASQKARLSNILGEVDQLKYKVTSKSHDTTAILDSVNKLDSEASALNKELEKYKI